jgi:hypothetical protein
MIEGLMTILTGGALGSITGLLGTLITKWDESRKRQADIELARVQGQQTRELVKLEQAHALQLAGLNAASQERLADINAMAKAEEQAGLDFRASHDSDRARYLAPEAQANSRLARWAMGAVDFLRGIIRPGATIYGYVLLTYLLVWVQQLYAEKALQLTPEQTLKLATEVIGTVTYLATTCATWWFGVRANSGRRV